jgi:hypothetical protein
MLQIDDRIRLAAKMPALERINRTVRHEPELGIIRLMTLVPRLVRRELLIQVHRPHLVDVGVFLDEDRRLSRSQSERDKQIAGACRAQGHLAVSVSTGFSNS